MKKLMSILALGIALVLPLNVMADSKIVLNSEGKIDCTQVEGKRYKCEVKVETTGSQPAEKLAVSITEHNATVDQSTITPGGEWQISESNFPNSIVFTSPLGATGAYTLFTFEYDKATDGTDCYVTVNALNSTSTNEPTTPDTPAENEQTGMTLPYVILGGALLIAGYAFVSTKNKSKLHKI